MKVSTQSLQETLGSLVDGGVQLATESDVVAGVQPYVLAAPGSEQEVASVLAYANREGLKVLVRGGGTQLNTGLPPGGGDILLSTRRLNQVVEYAPHDMTVTVQAGLRLVDLQSYLARARQWLALDPVLSPGATIGGIISTNVSGARRLRYGGVRDQIIGIRVVLSDGTIAKGGDGPIGEYNANAYDLVAYSTIAQATGTGDVRGDDATNRSTWTEYGVERQPLTGTSQVRLQVDQSEACLHCDRHVMRCILDYLVESPRTQQNIAAPWWKAGVELCAATSHDCLQSLTIGVGQHRRYFLLATRCR